MASLVDRFRMAVRAMRRPRYRSVMRIREGERTIALLAILLVVVLAGLYWIGQTDARRRSGTAAIHVVSTEFQPGGGLELAPQGTWVRYTYVVDGGIYPGFEFRPWNKVSAHSPKVCFEPADPRNHMLVEGRVQCGTDSVTSGLGVAASAVGSPTSARPSPTASTVEVHGESGTILELTLIDHSGLVLLARSATVDELRAHDTLLSTSTIAATNLDESHLLLIWLGSSCDRVATLDVEADLVRIELDNGPRPPCDLVPNPRGLVLETPDTVRADQIALELTFAQTP
jgi:hypothetical protein